MKKIYSVILVVLISVAASAQWNISTSPARRNFTKSEISGMESRRQELHSNIASMMRVDILNENFNGVMGPLPANLPAGWSTNVVVDENDDDMNAFRIINSTLANGGQYWPVPETGTNNKFAAANDDANPCDCDMIDVFLDTPELDFSGASNVAVVFDIFHDRGFQGGDATFQVSTDGGANFTILTLGTDGDGNPIDVLPIDVDYWQTVIVPVYDLSDESSVIFRWQWTDNNEWASGFAVDNVIVGELPDLDLKVDKVHFGNWNQETFTAGVWDYSRVPLTQVSPVFASAVLFNKGFSDQVDASVEFDVTFDGTPVSGSPFPADQTSALLLSLDRDTISVVTDYTPSATGLVEVTANAVSASGDDDVTNDAAMNSLLITDYEYARDANAAQAFVNPETDYEYGNLFDIYVDDSFSGIYFAVGVNSDEGATIQGKVYEWAGIDADGLPVLDDLGIETIEYEVTSDDFNTAGEGNFIFLPFADGNDIGAVTLEAGKTYLVTIASAGDVRVPVSGSNQWVASWLFDGEWGATLSIPMVRLSSEEALTISDQTADNLILGQNAPNPADNYTLINYTLNRPERVNLTIRDLSGRIVRVQEEGLKMAGKQSIRLDVDHMSAGVYTYTLTAGQTRVTKEMMVR